MLEREELRDDDEVAAGGRHVVSESAAAAAESTVASRLGGKLLDVADADVGAARERARLRRIAAVGIVLGLIQAYLWYRFAQGDPVNVFRLPSLPGDPVLWVIPLVFVVAIAIMVAMPLMSGRSPHVLYRPEQLDVTFDDVVGLDVIVDEVVKTLNTFLGYALFRDRLGGTPRRGLLFEGAPGTGKTHLAKAMANQAGVPFLYVSGTNFQSMWYGATARKIRSYFKVLRKTARREGGAIGFIEEIDAIATRRSGMASSPMPTDATSPMQGLLHSHGGNLVTNAFMSEGVGGVVNELLVQMQSFDDPPFGDRLYNRFVDMLNAFLPAGRQLRRRKGEYNNILLIAATNRAADLDPALLRPGRFDRRLTFELPPKQARRALIDHFLTRKAHAPALQGDELREQLAGQTFGYTPVMIEHLFDEALVHALRDGRDGLDWSDLQTARLTQEIGLKNPVPYTAKERQVVATHEAGHAAMAYLSGTRRLEVLSIIKRAGSLGLLAHGDLDEVYTRSQKEMFDLLEISLGGMVAEELWFTEPSTGPASDLAYATRVACEIVGSCGMAGSLVSLAAVEEGAFGSRNLVGRVLSDPSTRPEVDRVLAQAKARCRAHLDANRHIVEALRDALLARDELIGDDITRVIESAGAPVTEGLIIDRRGEDRRRRDWLVQGE
ncbi:MAG: AAA family ATPase [Nitriliruptorales bacterium]|nr:AAA family ATPase [Nitriliruptorales bacterium]